VAYRSDLPGFGVWPTVQTYQGLGCDPPLKPTRVWGMTRRLNLPGFGCDPPLKLTRGINEANADASGVCDPFAEWF